MNKQNANKMMSKKPLPKMRSLKNTATHLVFAGAGTEKCVTGPACGATGLAGCTRMSVNNCPNG